MKTALIELIGSHIQKLHSSREGNRKIKGGSAEMAHSITEM